MYLSLDTETGGVRGESLLTVGMVFKQDDYINKYHLEVKPDDGIYQITPESLTINKIDLVAHSWNAITYREAGTRIYNILKVERMLTDGIIVIGKNITFDLQAIWKYVITKSTWEQFCSYRTIDISSIVRYLRVTGHLPPEFPSSLEQQAEWFGLDASNCHNALVDAELTLGVFEKLCDIIKPST